MSLKLKLQRMKGHLTRTSADTTAGQREPLSAPAAKTRSPAAAAASGAIPFGEQWQALAATPYVHEGEYVLIREVRYPLCWQHGHYRLAELFDVIEMWRQSSAAHPLSSARLAADSLLFFDTETTGLHGGVGNIIFLLGTGRVEGDSVVVRQHFLPAPAAELALYQSFLRTLTGSEHLVTFNGKSFDWPQVKTRHTLIRHQLPQLPRFGHLDLLHGARRLWKDELPSCRLSLIERQKLGIWRTNDVPGQMAPLLYFDYLNGGDPRTIEGVLRHNENDLLSLITLYIHLSRLLLACECKRATAVSAEELFAVARWYEGLGDWERAAVRYQAIAESWPGSSHCGRAKVALGHIRKRQKKWQEALSIWEECMREGVYLPEEVYLESAKICEHQLKDYEKALAYTNMALAARKKKGSLLRQQAKAELAQYQKRRERLEQKLHRLF